MKYFLTLISSFILLSSKAQLQQGDSVYIKNIQIQGGMMVKSLFEKDYKTFAKYTYPAIVKMIGGEDKMAQKLKKSFEQMESQGISFTNCSIETPTLFVRCKNEIQCTITENIEMKVPQGRLVTKSTLIGISSDNGATWTFIDTQGKDVKNLRLNLPNLCESLIIPPNDQPTIYKE